MSFEKHTLAPRLLFALASSLCACGMAQEDPAKLPEPGSSAPAQPADPTPAAESQPAAKAPDGAAAPEPAKEVESAKTVDAGNPATEKSAIERTAMPAAPEPDLMSGIGKSAPSQNVTINLINRMVKKGLLSKEEAAELIAQAEQDVVIARNQTREDAALATKMVIEQAVTQNVIPSIDHVPDDGLRVTYIPETVKKQIRDDLKQEVLAAAKEQNWVAPKGAPEWVSRFRVKGDIRIRAESDTFPAGNDNTGAFPNFNAINTGAPFDIAGTQFSPQINVDQNRTRIRLRTRLGAEIDMDEGFTAGIRIATGESNTPTSTNQSFGLANQNQGGQFSKYAIWLDRAFLKYELKEEKDRSLGITVGRFDNPFFSTDLIYDEDVGFDGIAAVGRYEVTPKFIPFGTIGAFPVFNTDFNFSSNQPAKFKSTDKYLYAAQLGVDLKPAKNLELKVAGAYYYFDGVSGKLSTPYTPLTSSDAGDTDDTRPSFAQKGNTYMALRDIVPDASNNFGTTNQWQYFGLASKFRPIAATWRLDYNGFEPVQVSLTGEYIKNLAFDWSNIESKAVNNRGEVTTGTTTGEFAGGDTAWLLSLRAGNSVLEKRGNWQAGVNYRYIESDAVIDGFNDSDFGHGGTNMKGYTLWGTISTSARTWLTLRWMTASEIAGPPSKSDIFMIDFSGRF